MIDVNKEKYEFEKKDLNADRLLGKVFTPDFILSNKMAEALLKVEAPEKVLPYVETYTITTIKDTEYLIGLDKKSCVQSIFKLDRECEMMLNPIDPETTIEVLKDMKHIKPNKISYLIGAGCLVLVAVSLFILNFLI